MREMREMRENEYESEESEKPLPFLLISPLELGISCVFERGDFKEDECYEEM